MFFCYEEETKQSGHCIFSTIFCFQYHIFSVPSQKQNLISCSENRTYFVIQKESAELSEFLKLFDFFNFQNSHQILHFLVLPTN